MIKSMKTYWADYCDVNNHSREFMKNHWFGYTVHSLGIYLAAWGIAIAVNPETREYVVDEIKEKATSVKKKFSK